MKWSKIDSGIVGITVIALTSDHLIDILLGNVKDRIAERLAFLQQISLPYNYWISALIIFLLIIKKYADYGRELRSSAAQTENSNRSLVRENGELKQALFQERLAHHAGQSAAAAQKSLYAQTFEGYGKRMPYVLAIQLYEFEVLDQGPLYYTYTIQECAEHRFVKNNETVNGQSDVFPVSKYMLNRLGRAVRTSREIDLIQEISGKLTSASKLTDDHFANFALVNVAYQIVSNKLQQIVQWSLPDDELKMRELRDQKTGILESIIYTELVTDGSPYIFRKFHGQSRKLGRYYLANRLRLPNGKEHIVLITLVRNTPVGEIGGVNGTFYNFLKEIHLI